MIRNESLTVLTRKIGYTAEQHITWFVENCIRSAHGQGRIAGHRLRRWRAFKMSTAFS
jgi:hypothetical protein